MATKFFIKVVGVANYEQMVRYPSFSRNIENQPRVFDLIKSIEPDDRFVLYVKGHGFVGISCVKEKAVFDASPNDPNYHNPDYPHYIEVKEAEVLRQQDALPLSEVREWSDKSDELKSALDRRMQSYGGIFQISASDFDWFEHKIERQLRELGGILPTEPNKVLGETTEKVWKLMQNFDPQIIEKIADVLKDSKDLLEIKEWQNFELDFSTPFEEKNEIFQKIKNNIDDFKKVQGIYAIFDSDTCLYIGKGKRIWERIKSHYLAAKGEVKNKRWVGFFEQYQKNLKVFWIKYHKLNEPTLDDKLRGLFECVLQIKYNPIFDSFKL